MKYLATLFLPLLLLVGCNRSEVRQVSRFHDDGRAMPVVALTPVYDRHEIHIPWELAEDLTYVIKNRLARNNAMYINAGDSLTLEEHIRSGDNPFVGDLTWTKKSYKDSEFVIFMELVEHDMHPKQTSGSLLDKITPSYELEMTMRLRVVDLRSETPKIVLQELIHQTHLMPKPFAQIEFDEAKWGKKTYSISPLGLAHSSLCKEASTRLEEYILLAKSRSDARN